MYAIVEFKGNQYKAEKDAVLEVSKLDAKDGDVITIDTVLLVSDGDKVSVGSPYVKGVSASLPVSSVNCIWSCSAESFSQPDFQFRLP